MTYEQMGGTLLLHGDCSREDWGAQTRDTRRVLGWVELQPGVFECYVCLVTEEDGGYSVYMPYLPGVASQGETEPEALENISEAFRGVVAVYREDNEAIPWLDADEVEPIPSAAKKRWILVHV